MGELKREQVQTPAPQISVDNTQLVCQNCPTETVIKWNATDALVWAITSPDLTPILRQVDVDRCGGVGTMRAVLGYIAQHYPVMYPSETRITKDLGLARSTVQNSIKGLIQVGVLEVTSRKSRDVKVFGLPLYERSYELQLAPTSPTPDRHSGHKQNRTLTVTKTQHSDVDPGTVNEYQIAMSELASELRPDYSKHVKDLFTATMELMPAWRSDPKHYGKAVLGVLKPSVTKPGGVVKAMEQLLEQVQNIRPQVRVPAKVQSEPVPLVRPYQDCQPIYEALMQQLEPQQHLGNNSKRALTMISKIIKARPELATDLKEFAAQLNEATNTKDKQGTLMGLINLAHSLS